jgi:hypothetical protein
MNNIWRLSVPSMFAVNFLILGLLHGANASTFSCTAVDNKASVGVKDGESVSITTGKKTCSFSVGGASVDQKGAPDLLNALNALLAGNLDNLSRNDSGALAMLLVGPGGSQSDRTDIDNVVKPWVAEISKCISTSRSYSDKISFTSGPTSVEKDRLSCKVLPQAERPSKPFGQVEVLATDPVLQIGVEAGDKAYLVFIPYQLMQRGKAGFRYR